MSMSEEIRECRECHRLMLNQPASQNIFAKNVPKKTRNIKLLPLNLNTMNKEWEKELRKIIFECWGQGEDYLIGNIIHFTSSLLSAQKKEIVEEYKNELRSYGYGEMLEKFELEKAQNSEIINKLKE